MHAALEPNSFRVCSSIRSGSRMVECHHHTLPAWCECVCPAVLSSLMYSHGLYDWQRIRVSRHCLKSRALPATSEGACRQCMGETSISGTQCTSSQNSAVLILLRTTQLQNRVCSLFVSFITSSRPVGNALEML